MTDKQDEILEDDDLDVEISHVAEGEPVDAGRTTALWYRIDEHGRRIVALEKTHERVKERVRIHAQRIETQANDITQLATEVRSGFDRLREEIGEWRGSMRSIRTIALIFGALIGLLEAVSLFFADGGLLQ